MSSILFKNSPLLAKRRNKSNINNINNVSVVDWRSVQLSYDALIPLILVKLIRHDFLHLNHSVSLSEPLLSA